MKKTKKLFKENKVFRRVLAVVLSLSIIAGVAAVIAMAAPQPKAPTPTFKLPTTKVTLFFDWNWPTSDEYIDKYYNQGTIGLSSDGATATATPNSGYRFACWTTDEAGKNIYSYSPTIAPGDGGTYFAWFAQRVTYVDQGFWIGNGGWLGSLQYRADPDGTCWESHTNTGGGGDSHFNASGIGPAAYGRGFKGTSRGTESFSAFVLPKYKLLEDAAKGDPDISFQNFPATLFDYDKAGVNAAHTGKDDLHFFDNGEGHDNSSYVNMGGLYSGTFASQGILANELDANGLPLYNPTLVNSAKETAIFNPAGGAGVRSVTNANFQFIKYNDTQANRDRNLAGYYEYNNAMNHAQLEGSDVKQYYESNKVKMSNGGNDKGDFLPYDRIQDSTGFCGEAPMAYENWKNYLRNFNTEATAPEAVREKNSANYHNGLVMDFDFYMPVGKLDAYGHPIEFKFSGDDDFWVFIDGKLVLDIGGAHPAISGGINLTNGTAWVENAMTADDRTQKRREVTGLNFAEDQIHNIKIFSLERYAGDSNLRILFNLPPIPPASINVKKDVALADEQGNLTPINSPDTFKFKLDVTDQNGNVKSTAGVHYDIVNSNNEVVGGGSTDGNGYFNLKDGQLARFESFSSTDKYKVTEYIENPNKYSRVLINGERKGADYQSEYSWGFEQITFRGSTTTFTNILTDPLEGADLDKKAVALQDEDGNYTGKYEIHLTVNGTLANRNVRVTDVVSKYFTVVGVSDGGVVPPANSGADGTTTVTLGGTTDLNGDWTGVIKIVPRDGFWGGNAVPTNLGDPVFNSEAGISHTKEMDGMPKVNVAPNIPEFNVINYTIYLGQYIDIGQMINAHYDFIDTSPHEDWAADYLGVTFGANSKVYERIFDHAGTFGIYAYASAKALQPGDGYPGPILGTAPSSYVTQKDGTITVLGCTLTINKKAAVGTDLAGHNFIFNIKGSSTGNALEKKINHKVVLNSGNNYTAVIEGLPIGTYTVQEDGWSWRFTANGNGTVTLTPDAAGDHGEFTITNTKTENKWLDHEYNKNNVFGN